MSQTPTVPESPPADAGDRPISAWRRPELALLRVSGRDARTFLQGQLTCDVPAPEAGRWQWGGYCTAKGRLVAVFRLACEGESYCLQLPADTAGPLVDRLRRFVLRAKVTLDVADGWSGMQLAGATEAAALAAQAGLPQLPPPGAVAVAADALVMGLDGHEWVVHAGDGHAVPGIVDLAASGHWLRDVRAGFPWITAAAQERFIPQMVDLDVLGGVSFSKGCYPGQEIVARARYLGETRRRLHGIETSADGELTVGESVVAADGRPVGEILLAARTVQGSARALAVIDVAAAGQPGLGVESGLPLARVFRLHPDA